MRAGTLEATFAGGRALGGSWFRYDNDYFATKGAYELDPSLPRTTARIFSGEDQSLFGAFQDLTPDDWGRRVIDANLTNARALDPSIASNVDEFDYLALTSDETRTGAIRFRSTTDGEWVGQHSASDLNRTDIQEYVEAAARFEAHEATTADIELLGAPGTSAGGARPKITANVDGELRLIKLPSERDRGRDGEAWEYVAIQLAQRAGINVQTGELWRAADGRSSLALRRFDREAYGARIGYMSARTAMELSDQLHNQATYEDLADTTDALTSGDRAQLKDLFKRVALTVLINNVDDHWKNHGFLHHGQVWSLSPAFDVNPSPSQGVVISRPISSRDDPRQRDIRNLVRTAGTYALSQREAAQALGEVLTAVEEWESLARSLGIHDDEIRQMTAAFSEHQQAHARAAIGQLFRGTSFIDLA